VPAARPTSSPATSSSPTAPSSATPEGGAFGGVPGSIRLDHTIVSGNRNGSGPHFFNGPGNPISEGHNLVDVPGGFLPHYPSTDLQGVPARLSPLGWHGGRCPTYHPLANSPAIDGGNPAAGIFTYDQRDFLFTRDGDDNGSAIVDIGAVEAFNPVFVTTSVDENGSPTPNRSLREAVANVGNGGRILFDPALNGTTFAVGPSPGEISVGGKAILIDATTLPNGITLDCLNSNRAFNILPFGGLSMHAVSIKNGNVSGSGGAILNQNILTLSRAAFYDNNASDSGGALLHGGPFLVLDHCTLTDNVGGIQGGALMETNGGAFCIAHCTISHNDVTLGIGGAGGIQLTSGHGEIIHTLLANNTGGQFANFHDGTSGSLTSCGYERVTNGIIDIGAHEWTAAPIPDFDGDGMPDSYESTTSLDPLDPNDAGLDNDGDGQTNLAECLTGTDPNDPLSLFQILSISVDLDAPAGSRSASLLYTSKPGASYHIYHSPNLSTWSFAGVETAGAGATDTAYVVDPGFTWSNANPGFFLMSPAP